MSKNIKIDYKIITLGESGVGKSSIIKRFIENKFEDNLFSTIGMDFTFKEIILENNVTIKLKIMDTSGQEKFRSLSKSYYKNADGVFFVFALNNKDSFNKLDEWIKSFNENYILNPDIPKYLVGNKNDLSCKDIDKDSIEKFSSLYNMKYYETSAKENTNIDAIFHDIGQKLYENYLKSGGEKVNQINHKINLKKHNENNCCTLSGDL